jgi:hypothetical protein
MPVHLSDHRACFFFRRSSYLACSRFLRLKCSTTKQKRNRSRKRNLVSNIGIPLLKIDMDQLVTKSGRSWQSFAFLITNATIQLETWKMDGDVKDCRPRAPLRVLYRPMADNLVERKGKCVYYIGPWPTIWLSERASASTFFCEQQLS